MKIEVELPDDTHVGFVNFVYGDFTGMFSATLSLDSKRLKAGKATYLDCVLVGERAND